MWNLVKTRNECTHPDQRRMKFTRELAVDYHFHFQSGYESWNGLESHKQVPGVSTLSRLLVTVKGGVIFLPNFQRVLLWKFRRRQNKLRWIQTMKSSWRLGHSHQKGTLNLYWSSKCKSIVRRGLWSQCKDGCSKQRMSEAFHFWLPPETFLSMDGQGGYVDTTCVLVG